MEKKKTFVVCSCHMDREWYFPYEKNRIYIAAAINRVLDIMGRQPDYRFMMDGQTSVLEDFLEIYPEREAEITRFVREGRLTIGPWYIQPDECLPCGESFVRNLLLGDKIARRFGKPLKVGYSPDAFGHNSQMPQIFSEFGITNAFLMRGCPEGTPRDFIWRGADGSELLAICYPYGTCSITEDPMLSKGMRLAATREEFERSLAGSEGLSKDAAFTLVTFCGDMMPPPEDPAALGVPSYDCLSDCFAEMEGYKDTLPVLEGELRESSDVLYLRDTLLSRVYIKQENQRVQNTLIRFAEPLNALAFGASKRYPAGFMEKAWKYLIDNHTHDGICACSADGTCREMMTRFEKSSQIATTYARIAMETVASKVDTRFCAAADEQSALVVFNPLPYPSKDPVSVTVHFPKGKAPASFAVTDQEGHDLPCQITEVHDSGIIQSNFVSVQHFNEERFYKLDLLPGELPAFGVKAFCIKVEEEKASKAHTTLKVSTEKRRMENEWISLTVKEDGTLTLLDKATGHCYQDLNYLVEEGDGGDAYGVSILADEPCYDSRKLKWEIDFLKEGPVTAVCRLRAVWELPAGMTVRGGGRTSEKVPNALECLVSLSAGSPVVQIKLQIDNRSKDHRIRAHFPTQIQSDHSWADGQFSLEKREGPLLRGTMPQQTFCAVSGSGRGLAVLQKGLHQYEYLNGPSGVLVLSLLRGYGTLYRHFFERYIDTFLEGECIGEQKMEYAIYPFAAQSDALPEDVLRQAAKFQAGVFSAQTDCHDGVLSAAQSFLQITAGGLELSSFKLSEDRSRIIARFYNPRREAVDAKINLNLPVNQVVRMNLQEEVLSSLPVKNGVISFSADAGKIVTIGFDGIFSPLMSE